MPAKAGVMLELKPVIIFINQKRASVKADARESGRYAGTKAGDHGVRGRKKAGKSQAAILACGED